ncbi:MFS transporter [Acidocella sp.]|uniref:MFS transporter n=1 Tax=Acidocella sp. TaxID=50710 RepID=UPI002627C401|nr:MFS transporter [Acidocella sp.]
MNQSVHSDGLPEGRRQQAMFAVAMSVLLSVLDYAVVNVALPRIAASIGCTDSSAIWVINAYQLVTLVALLPVAALGDRLGHAKLCLWGIGLFLLASVLCALSRTLPELAAARGLQGLGAACILGVNAALLRRIYPARLLGRGIALNGLVIGLGVALGPTVAACVLAVTSWPWLFLINLPMGGLGIYFALKALPETPRISAPFDYVSTVLLALAVGPLIIGGDGFAHRESVALDLTLIGGGLLCLGVLVVRQMEMTDPLLPVDLLRRPAFRVSFLTGFVAFVGSNFFMIPMPFALMNVLHKGPVATGLLITPWPVAIMVVAPVVGRLTDRFPAAILSSIGLAMTGMGFFLLWTMGPDPSDFAIAWRVFVAGAGFGLFQPPNNKAMLITAPVSRTGGASGMISVARLMGQTVGGMLVALTLGLVAQMPTQTCLMLASIVTFGAAGISVSRNFVKGGRVVVG